MTERTLLLVDDEQNIVSALTRLFRRDGYRILTANSGKEGLEKLAQHEVGVILSDQRMPEMNGSEFLSRVKELHPDTVRIMLSGYTDLNSVTDAINRGAIYRFLTKPWEDDLLRANVADAFKRYELTRENERLAEQLRQANEQLRLMNHDLEVRVQEKAQEMLDNVQVLRVSQQILDAMPVGVLGIGEEGLVAIANERARKLFARDLEIPLIGAWAKDVLPAEMLECIAQAQAKGKAKRIAVIDGEGPMLALAKTLGFRSDARGVVVALIPQEEQSNRTDAECSLAD